jgi:DNA-damage-inducible protein D
MEDSKQLDTNVIKTLDQCRRYTPQGKEFWSARDIYLLLKYSDWRVFEDLIDRAKQACATAGYNDKNHFVIGHKMVALGSNSKRDVTDYALSRLACYLIAMNGESGKIEIATAQAYFATKTRQQEIFDQLPEEEKRVILRERVKKSVKELNGIALSVGVTEFGLFHDAGYRGLYGGLGKKEIQKKKGIPEKEDLLDCIGRYELSANEFRLTQTEQKLVYDNIKGDLSARDTHRKVGKEVRDAIQRIGGKMPEDLPREESIKKLQKANNKHTKELPKGS